MDNANRSEKAHVSEAASELLKEGKKWANEMCDEGINRACEAEENLRECTDQLLKKVQQNPLTSILIAGGVGFLLSKIMRK
ncbi:hypothetical protein [Legionella saoudiensis]|uniref:hypothetical protein n=1 Tax=Legionella saoudiensis TaxID=1750561 RepID=UPI0007319735|nr:hypothetical protein [Legionella saoudiensis]